MNQGINNFLSLFTNMEVKCPKMINLSKGALRMINPMILSFSDNPFAFASYNHKCGLV